jgi:hypothetical protein
MPDAPNQFAHWLQRYWPAALIGSIWLWMFWPMISGQTVCGFRDSAYLYYPLFKWIDSVWASGEIPLWNPYCNYGLPVVGDGSSSVFYPGKLIFLCRFLSYPSRYGIYLSAHVLIAAAGAYRFARVMKANQAGATLAAISYAFGGSVLFQVTNVIYLVSAAWLPFALAFVWRGVLDGDWRSTTSAGVVCALMILGGDPQMVYHVGLIAAASLLFRFWGHRRWLLKHTRSSCHAAYRWLAFGGARLALMVMITSCLAAIQILPTAHWAERSERAATGQISNVVQAWNYALEVSEPTPNSKPRIRLDNWAPITYLNKAITRSLFGSHPTGSAQGATYQFSQPPWSIAELFFPNLMGKPFPTHQRWSDALPAAERIWTPSVYAGVLTVLLAMSQFRLWGKRKRHVWLSRIALFFAIASLGWFGAVWLLNEGLAVFGLSELEIGGLKIGPQVGGLYWFMTTLLPKYFMFRYPAKLFVIASLMVSVLAGLGLSRITNTSPTRKRADPPPSLNPLACASGLYSGIAIGVVSIVGLVALQIIPIASWLGRIRPNLFFGPLDVDGTIVGLNLSLAQPLIVLAILTALFRLTKSRLNVEIASKVLAILIVLLTTIDIVLANRWMLAEVDSSVFESPTKIGDQLKELKARHPNTIPRIYRSFAAQARTQTWPYKTSTDRLAEIITWRRETLFPKHHLEHGVALLGSFGSVWPHTYEHLTDPLDAAFSKSGQLPQPMAKRYRVAGQMIRNPSNDLLTLQSEPQNFRLVETRVSHPFRKPSRHVRFRPKGSIWEAWFQWDTGHKVRQVEHTNRAIKADALVEQPYVQLHIYALHDEGWQAEAQDVAGSPAYSCDIRTSPERIGMGVDIARGNRRVTFTYSPREFWIGCWISGFSWFPLTTALIATHAKRNKRRPTRRTRQ